MPLNKMQLEQIKMNRADGLYDLPQQTELHVGLLDKLITALDQEIDKTTEQVEVLLEVAQFMNRKDWPLELIKRVSDVVEKSRGKM